MTEQQRVSVELAENAASSRALASSDLRVTRQTVTRYRFSGDRVILIEQFESLPDALQS